jgi:uncharacterized protein
VTPRAVFDTNVLISALLFRGSVSEKAFALSLSGAAGSVTSPAILAELEDVLKRKFRLSKGAAQEIAEFVRDVSECVEPAIVIDAVVKDPADNLILECALWGDANFLVTGDKAHLLPLDPFRGIRIVSPRQFLETFT